jgi:hypothetical protein
MRKTVHFLLLACLAVLPLTACPSSTSPSNGSADFVVDVAGETFVLRLSDPDTVRLARERLAGRNSSFPIGPLRSGDGGFNAPWSWHLDPAQTRMTEIATEVCDGSPSYVEGHQSDFPTYCPWSARITAER